jgi:uncharacterized protein (DUF305 family)
MEDAPVRSVREQPVNVDGVRHPDERDDPEPDVEPAGPSWSQAIVLGLALAFLGFAVAMFLGRDRSPGAGSVDVGFYQDMATHHEQALDMALMELADGSEPTARSFASEVLLFQSRELGVMEQTLFDWGYSRDDRAPEAMTWMDGMDPVPPEQMPGMIDDQRLTELDAAEGRAADALFLELMAEHHRGGLHMAEYAAEHAEDEAVRDMAARLWRGQAMEINEYAMAAERLGLPAEIERVDVPEEPG